MSANWKLRDIYNLICSQDPKYLRSLFEGEGWEGEYRPTLENDHSGASPSGPIVMQSKFLWDEWGFSAQLHKFVAICADEPAHNHQATVGYRQILLGGYDEEVTIGTGAEARTLRKCWRAGDCGLIHHNYMHRIVSIQPEGAMSLWIRGPTKHNVTWRFPSGAVRTVDKDGNIL